jgi:hypothetical protein
VIGAAATLLGTAVTLGIPKREAAPSTDVGPRARASGAALDALEH